MTPGIGDQRAGFGIKRFQLAQILKHQHGARISAQIPHAGFKRGEIAKRCGLIEHEQRLDARADTFAPGAVDRIKRAAHHHP